MIAVIILFQLKQYFLRSNIQFDSQPIHILFHLSKYLIPRYTTNSSIRLIHADIFDVIEFTENAEL